MKTYHLYVFQTSISIGRENWKKIISRALPVSAKCKCNQATLTNSIEALIQGTSSQRLHAAKSHTNPSKHSKARLESPVKPDYKLTNFDNASKQGHRSSSEQEAKETWSRDFSIHAEYCREIPIGSSGGVRRH